MKKLSLVWLCLLAVFTTFAQSAADLYTSGNDAYKKGNYVAASSNYEKALKLVDAPSENLYFNLANAYFKQKRLALAILNYEKALKFKPGFELAEENLAIANALIADQIEPKTKQKFSELWYTFLVAAGASRMGGICLLSWALAGIAFVVFLKAKNGSLKKTGFFTGIFLAIFSFISLFIGVLAYNAQSSKTFAIVTQLKIDAKLEPKKDAATSFVLHEGCKVEILNESEAWYEITLVNGNIAWLPKQSIQEI